MPLSLPVLSCSEPTLLVRACNQLGQFLQHRETNLRYLALESMCMLASSEFSHETVKTHIETVINALKVSALVQLSDCPSGKLNSSGPHTPGPRRRHEMLMSDTNMQAPDHNSDNVPLILTLLLNNLKLPVVV